eukprot:2203229-Rhodomonas_salina.1
MVRQLAELAVRRHVGEIQGDDLGGITGVSTEHKTADAQGNTGEMTSSNPSFFPSCSSPLVHPRFQFRGLQSERAGRREAGCDL